MKPLHDKKHTLAKRGLSLLCVLALCLSLLPATALAAAEGAPSTLYVGNQNVKSGEDTTYWATTDSGELELVEGASDTSNNWKVKYDPSTATLTLNGATIQGGSNTVSAPYGSGIYALSRNGQPVSLTIELIGTNTITGHYGIYVNANQGTPSGADASLVIKNSGDNGSLTVTGTGNSGLLISSGSGDASLTIKDVSVVASSRSSYYGNVGVCVQSGSDATSSPQLSLAVNGGSLTTSASEGNDGIQFYVGSSEATGATTSLTVSDNAIVDAKNGGISADGVSVKPNVNIGSTVSTGGIVWNGTEGTVYGNVTLQEDLEIGEDETLTIPEGSSLNCNGKLTNDGTINVENGGRVSGNLSGGSTVTTPSISVQPQNKEVTAGETATFTVEASAGSETPTYQWQQKTAASGSDWTDISGATSADYTTETTTTNMDGYQYRCVVKSASGVSVISQTATLTVQAKPASVPVTGVKLNTETLELFTGNTATLTATVAPENATNPAVIWSSSDNTVATVDNNGNVTAVKAGTATITATAADGSGCSATCTVTVTDKTYTISADPTALNFGSAYTGYTQPAAQTVTLTNTGNQPVTLTQPASTNSFEVGTLSKTKLAAGETATFTIQPKDKLPRGSYSEQITISGNDGASATLTATFTVKEPPYTGKYSYEIATDIGDNGAISVDRYATEGDKVTIDVTPDQAYKLDELVVTANGKDVELTANSDGTYTFTMPSADVRITATFAEDPDWSEPEEPATDVSDIFLDIAPNAWYKDAVQYAYDSGLMTGVSANEFAPEQTTTHAMIVSMLARLEGVESANNAGFADVSNEWYATAVNWAANVGVVNGYEDSTFRPNTAITREQLAAILMNYAQYKGQDVSARADLNGYTNQPSTWAQEAISWSVVEGLLTGVTADTLQPQGAATRAQVAAILQRFLSE